MSIGINHNDYKEHLVFKELKKYSEFYNFLSGHVMSYVNHGLLSEYNLDTYVFSSMQGTLESIHDILLKGRINDSYALLRKYYDSTVMNIYTNLYLENEFGVGDDYIVAKIENWRAGKEILPEYGIMSKYIDKSVKLLPITLLLNKDKSQTYQKIRTRCNNHTHYNYYYIVISNDNEIYSKNRIQYLNLFKEDLTNLFMRHISYLFYLKSEYMSSTDYVDYLECGLTPPENSQDWVASFIQEIFNSVIKANRNDIYTEIKNSTSMMLE